MTSRRWLALGWLVGCSTAPTVEPDPMVARLEALEAEVAALAGAVRVLQERCETRCEEAVDEACDRTCEAGSRSPCVVHNADGTVTVRPCRPQAIGPDDEMSGDARERRREDIRRRLRERRESQRAR